MHSCSGLMAICCLNTAVLDQFVWCEAFDGRLHLRERERERERNSTGKNSDRGLDLILSLSGQRRRRRNVLHKTAWSDT